MGIAGNNTPCFPDVPVLNGRKEAVEKAGGEEARRLADRRKELGTQSLTILPYP